MRLIFDGHTDIALFALAYDRDQTQTVEAINAREADMTDVQERGEAANSLPNMRRAGVAVCQAAIAARTNPETRSTSRLTLDYATHSMAYASAQAQLAYYRILEREGEVRLITTATQLNEHWQCWETSNDDHLPVGMIIAMECADPIVDPHHAEEWWEDGLRSVMLAHFGHSQYAAGTGVSGPLTARGLELLKEFERLGMILDLSHLSDESFYQALDRFSGPVIASHNNCRALVPGDRQLSDEQLKLMIERDAVVGQVLDAWMLVPGWVHGMSNPDGLELAAVADHIDHVCQLAGNTDHAAIGSDTGGRNHMPTDLQSTEDLHKIGDSLLRRGYSESDVDNIFHGNWLRFFRQWLP